MANESISYTTKKGKRKISKKLGDYIRRHQELAMARKRGYSSNPDAVLKAMKEEEKLKGGGFR